MSAATQSSNGSVTVLVVEDETLIRLLATDILKDAGFEVIAAGHGGEALKILKSDRRIDFVLTDVTMPGAVNGIALVAWIRANRPGLPVAFASGVGRLNLSQLGLKDDDVFFPKPVDFDRVAQHIRTVTTADQARSASATIAHD